MNLLSFLITRIGSHLWRIASSHKNIAGNSPQDMNFLRVLHKIKASRRHKHCLSKTEFEPEMDFHEAHSYFKISLFSKGFFIFSKSAILNPCIF